MNTPKGIIPKGIRWKILYGAGDVAVYNGLKKIFHVFPEEAEIVVKILNDLESEVERLRHQRDQWVRNWNQLDKLYQSLQSELARCKEDTPRYVTDEEIDARWPITESHSSGVIIFQRQAAKAMRDMIFGKSQEGTK